MPRDVPLQERGSRFTGSCPIREHTAEGHYVGRCEFATYDGFCPRHGALVDYADNDDREVMACDRRMSHPRGDRKGQLRYYIRATARERWGRKWNRFWSARWFWSAGRLGPIPVGYRADYWRRADG